ncbi:potassium channel family protein [Mycolicibacterium moriokaense]|uniref:Voltage-gated potassium channel n=1 Tax=Mycolicibacterium moriokaense TaxID=39691 RepID=A0A318HP47_9MYCO|nr:potassium channel family protein [Mycolicibacterium moriokaense]PXX10289.1 voltage-gated potassium channel [Mycolicibacterium moriokaense]
MHPQTRLGRFEHHTEWPLAAVALLFLGLYSAQILLEPRGSTAAAITDAMRALYFVFVVDYLARLYLADPRAKWFVRHLFDLAIVVLPFLRPLRLLSLAVVVEVLQRAVGDTIRGRVIIYTVFGAAVMIYAASLAMLDVERHAPDAHIKTFGDALWWAITTVTTVGYGDYTPVTGEGRIVAVALMIGGVTLLGVVTATLASWIVQRVAAEDTANQTATWAQIEELREEIHRLTKLVADDREPAYGEGREGI